MWNAVRDSQNEQSVPLDTKDLTKLFLMSVLDTGTSDPFLKTANFLTPQTDAVEKRSAKTL